MLKNLKKYNIILASGSPRREYLLRELGLNFNIFVKDDIDEQAPPDLHREEIAVYLARHKALHYTPELKNNTMIITADTIVCLGDEIMNKPADVKEARQMLTKLSGNYHDVITGICVRTLEKSVCIHTSTRVHFKNLEEEEIEYYITNYKPFDKAGGYGIQEWIGYTGIDRIEGSYFNVMGLPVQKLYEELKKF